MKSNFIKLCVLLSTGAFYVNAAYGKTDMYTNPVLHMDYSDPDAIRVGDDYYLTASSFANTPGLPILFRQKLMRPVLCQT